MTKQLILPDDIQAKNISDLLIFCFGGIIAVSFTIILFLVPDL